MTANHWPPRPGLSRARARSEVNALLDMLKGTGVSYSVHAMQQQKPLHEGHLEYYERRAKQAEEQSDAHQGEVYDDDLDCWVPEPVLEALCGPMGRVA